MAKTPFIRPLQVQGGTFYTFSSAAEDLAFTFNNSVNKFRFSKFALLNIPDISTTASQDNTVKLNAPDSAFIDWSTGTYNLVPSDANIAFSQSFQSYCLNLETTITSSDEYDPSLKQNVSERVFWKWMREIGALRFKAASSEQVSPSLDQNSVTFDSNGLPVTQKRYVEGDEPTGQTGGYGLTGPYSKVVQYIGGLDIVNSVRNQDNAYSEVYIHVPTGDGGTPYVLFKTVADENYYPDRTFTHLPPDPLDTEYLQGRDSASGLYGPNGLPKLAIFDQDVLGEPGVTGISATGTFLSNWYSPRDEANSYFTDPSFFDNSNYTLEKYVSTAPAGYSVNYKRSNLDGVQIDFEPSSYKAIQNYVGISTIEEWNGTPTTTSFEFNAVLVYYDVYDPNNPTDSETNLYGILFLNDPEPVSINAAKFPNFKKFKPDPITKLNGNSYGFKINLKFDTDVESTGVEQAINDYSSFSLSIFMDAATVLQDAAKNLNDRTLEIMGMQDQITALTDLVINTDDSTDIKLRLDTVEKSLQANQALFDNTQDILSLIERNSDTIQNILQNQTSINMTYNLDLLKDGDGTFVDRSTPNILKVDVTQQDYNIGTNSLFTINPVAGNTVSLQLYTNYLKHKNNGLSITANNDIVIKIDDTTNKWQKGQVLRLVIGDDVDLGVYSLVILTDALGEYPKGTPSGVPYSSVVAGFINIQFQNASYKPIFDIVCVDDKNLIFEVDQIK